MAGLMLSKMEIKKNILADEKYKYLFTVDEVNKLVMTGIPFRDAYKIVGQKVEQGAFSRPPLEQVGKGVHEGSIGNLCTDDIKKQMKKVIDSFPFESIHAALSKLLE